MRTASATKREIIRERIARAVKLGRGPGRGWERRQSLPNRGTATSDALRRAQAKRDRRKLRNLVQVARTAGVPDGRARDRALVAAWNDREQIFTVYRPAWKRAR